MKPELDRRQRRPETSAASATAATSSATSAASATSASCTASRTSDTAGWHSFDFIVRQALQVQREIGTPGAVELLQNIGLNPQVIARVLSPERQIRAEDLQALASRV